MTNEQIKTEAREAYELAAQEPGTTRMGPLEGLEHWAEWNTHYRENVRAILALRGADLDSWVSTWIECAEFETAQTTVPLEVRGFGLVALSSTPEGEYVCSQCGFAEETGTGNVVWHRPGSQDPVCGECMREGDRLDKILRGDGCWVEMHVTQCGYREDMPEGKTSTGVFRAGSMEDATRDALRYIGEHSGHLQRADLLADECVTLAFGTSEGTVSVTFELEAHGLDSRENVLWVNWLFETVNREWQ